MTLEALGKEAVELISLYSLRLLAALVILACGRRFAGLAATFTENALAKRISDLTIRQFLGRLVFALIMIFSIVAALSNVGIQTASIVATGLALQGSLANFAAGVLLVIFRPCRVGDYIEAGPSAGTVKDISLFFTTPVTADNRQIVAPNSAIMAVPITHYSVLPQRRPSCGSPSITAWRRARRPNSRLCWRAMRASLIIHKWQLLCWDCATAPSPPGLRAWVKPVDLAAVYADLPEAIKLYFDKLGIAFSFPQQTALQAPAPAR